MHRALACLLIGALAGPAACFAAEYRSTGEPANVLYDAPSTKARPLFVYGREVPVELLVSVEGWTKVRDAGGSIGWMQSRSLADKRVVVVRSAFADVRATPEESAPVVFRAERDVLLEVTDSAASPTAAATPGWIKVRHRDGAAGYVRLTQVFGF